MTIARTTIKGVQLVKTGTWGGMTGQSTITEQHLSDAVQAYADREIDRAAIKIGHDGDLNLGTGHPALGWVENLRLSEDRQTLIGDLSQIPSKLASIIPAAFRRRSVEMRLGVTTPSGRKYAGVLDALSLLGAKAPAVKGLDDIVTLYAAEAGDPDQAQATETVALSIEGAADTAPVPHAPDAAGNAGDGSNNPTERGASVALLDALKKKLGLPETATDAEVEAAVEAAELAAPAEPITDPAPAAAPAPADAEPAPAPAADAASLAEGDTVRVSKVVFGEMQAQLAALTTESAANRKAKALDDAIAAGKISPAERVAFAATLDANEEAGIALLSSLAPRIAVIELGADHAPHADAELDDLERQAIAAGL
ncbi:scaffolding protein [Arthrobacter phage Jinkies]|uniref:Scaffolding protein n=1 Tax=Arthrobacter phage Jinkies TaxID=2743903 RepID=A0A7S6BF74_9CAUD|nr:scaffolding protein [Arthrobacter phage Jinkies]